MRARRGRAARAVLAAALVAGASATVGAPGAAGQSPDLPSAPDREFGLFLNVLPPGQGSSLTPEQALRFEATGERPAHGDDQLAMYAALPAAGDLSAADLSRFFKSEGWVLPAEDMVRVDSPRPGLTIVRDRFGVPHVYGETRADAAFGLGYVTAMDRLFMADVLRHVGRGRLSQFLGPTESNLALDRDTYLVAGYSEEELQAQVDRLVELGPAGRQVVEDGESFIAGINARVDEVILDPSQMPAEYGALQLVPTHWSPTDVVAVAILIQATFAGGGGGELSNAAFLQHAAARHGEERALALWRDLRTAEDPEAPVTTEGSFPFMAPGPVDPAAVALPDPGSVTPVDPISTAPSSGAGLPAPAGGTEPAAPILRGLARLAEGFPSGMSNWLAVTADRSASGHPVAVMGPQTGYFVPEILMEVAVHAPGFDARGATFPGVSLYVLLGRGPDFAWSATSGGSDLIDVRAELLCDPEGGTPAPDA
ncbi:MAG: penicillin acylase family protein, partial [Actinobacteria bacterium]|nr:penicillin acylase family protein [Actinomycetota bacterium]